MAIEERDHFEFTLKCYNSSGLRQTSTSRRRFISVYILYPLLLAMYSLMIFNIRYQNNVFEISEVFESVSSFGHLVARKTILLVHAPLFEEIIQDRSCFWNYDLFGKSIGKKFRNQTGLCVSLIKFMWIGGVMSVASRCYALHFVEGYLLPDTCYIPGNSIYSVVILFALELIFYTEAIFMVGVFDAFFLLMCVDLKIQFTLLNKALRTMKFGGIVNKKQEEIRWNQLKKCFEHHGVYKKLNKAFSEFFVCTYFFAIGGMCIQFFIALDGIVFRPASADYLIKIMLYIAIVSVLIILVVIPVGEIEIE
ncbi:uncharacterized protein BDFB_010714, partial [Asbolus verrucosus]